MSIGKYFIMGLPEAGKTTYLAALWYILNNSKESSLRVDNYTGDHSYLADIGKKWANIEKMPRTLKTSEKLSIELPLTNSQNKQIILAFPDLSGESFQEQYVNRVAKIEHAEFIKDCLGVLLFIHPEKIIRPSLISDIPKNIRTSGAEEAVEVNKPRDPKDDPTQVQLVELLQFVRYLRNDQKLDLTIVISAWDLLETRSHNWKPQDLVKKELPLLWQYAKSNSEIFSVTYYGISAQGGKLNEIDRLLEISDPCDRVKFVDQDGNESRDITLLISKNLSDNNE